MVTFFIFLVECLAGFGIGIAVVCVLAYFIAYGRTDKSISEMVLSEDEKEKADKYIERAGNAASEGYEEVFKDVYEVLLPLDVKDSKMLCWHGDYEYIKPVMLYSCSENEVLKSLTYIAVSELLSEGYEAGPDVLLEAEMSDEAKKNAMRGFGNCMSHEITPGTEEIFKVAAAMCSDMKKRVLLSNTWFSKYYFKLIGAPKTQNFFSDVIDDIYKRSPEAAFAIGVRLYKEIIRMQKNY